MSGSSDPELLRRLVDFELDLQRDSSEEVDEFEWGHLVYNPRTTAMWSDNFLEVESGDIDADRLMALADQLLGGRGMEHRYVVPRDPRHGERLEPRFRELGWEAAVLEHQYRDHVAGWDHFLPRLTVYLDRLGSAS